MIFASGVTVAVIVVPRPVQHGGVRKYHAENALITDQPVAALITDLKQRGLLDETLVVWAGEMGMGVVEKPACRFRQLRWAATDAHSVWIDGILPLSHPNGFP